MGAAAECEGFGVENGFARPYLLFPMDTKTITTILGAVVAIVYAFAKADEVKTNMKSGACHRCGRTSHWVAHCYAKKHLLGYDL
jgi:hypothetical protein